MRSQLSSIVLVALFASFACNRGESSTSPEPAPEAAPAAEAEPATELAPEPDFDPLASDPSGMDPEKLAAVQALVTEGEAGFRADPTAAPIIEHTPMLLTVAMHHGAACHLVEKLAEDNTNAAQRAKAGNLVRGTVFFNFTYAQAREGAVDQLQERYEAVGLTAERADQQIRQLKTDIAMTDACYLKLIEIEQSGAE